MRKHSVKNNRVSESVRAELSRIIREELKDPRVALMTSVTRADVAPDLKTCKVGISVLGSDEEREDTIAGLRAAAGFIRRELARSLNLRNTPELNFYADNSIAYGVEMSKKIDEAMGNADETGDDGTAEDAEYDR